MNGRVGVSPGDTCELPLLRRKPGCWRRRGWRVERSRVDALSRTTLHTLLVDLLTKYIRQAFAADDNSPVVEARSYFDAPDAEYRYDAVGLDADGEIVVAGEAERPNNDRFEAVPEDYDKLSAADPMAAIWVTRTRTEAHDVLTALHEPASGAPRVDQSYSENSPPSRWQIDAPGFTELYTALMLQRQLELQ